ncbi:MAG: YbaK/EbsC family protein [candidate division Zixibacteria bacterium]|nr:YbaK/EbsC family protein [candidate division Zixibacteria bacterium]MCI0595948.1 YbaK/EbsC family protein [candidate division Zixibacteria bacterium]
MLSPSAQKVQDTLHSFGFTCEVRELSATTRSAAEAAAAIGCQVAQIAKSLVFRTRTSGKPVLVIASGKNRVDEKKLSAYLGEPIERADADFVRAKTGFAIGGVPPVGHSEKLETFIDEALFQYDTIWAAAGTPNAVFQLAPRELVKLTGGKVERVK